MVSCGDEGPAPVVAVLPVQGAAIDGSEDLALEEAEVEEPTPVPVVARPEGDAQSLIVSTDADPEGEPTSELPAGLELPAELEEEVVVEPNPKPPVEPEPIPEPEPEPVAAEQEGPVVISYRDLTLIDYDVDAMLDYMLFPEEYEDEEVQDLQFPAALKALDGKEISIVGYMIPGEMDQGNVLDFMLVRDLLGCCFGGTPMPDEWLDVIMVEGAEAEYRPYMPTRVTGILTLSGQQDEAGFALGIYMLKGTHVTVED